MIFITPVIVTSSIITYFLVSNSAPKKVIKNDNKYTVSIEGAVEHPGDYQFDQPHKLRRIIFEANLKTNADISSINMEEIISNDFKMIIPFKIGTIQKIKWNDINSVDQLTKRGVKKSTAQKIVDFKRKNSNPSWEKIHAIKGIGQITLNQLKDVIDLS